jgi:hypothetical protein
MKQPAPSFPFSKLFISSPIRFVAVVLISVMGWAAWISHVELCSSSVFPGG